MTHNNDQQRRVNTIMGIATQDFDRAVIEFEKMNRNVTEYELEEVHMGHPVVRELHPDQKTLLEATMQLSTDEDQPKIVTWTSFSLAQPLLLTKTSRSEIWLHPDDDITIGDVTLVSKTKTPVDPNDVQAAWDSLPEDMKEMSRLFSPDLAERFDRGWVKSSGGK